MTVLLGIVLGGGGDTQSESTRGTLRNRLRTAQAGVNVHVHVRAHSLVYVA
jgi:hypothetical protein